MKKYTLSLLLILLILNGNRHVTASDLEKLEISLTSSRNHTLGPTLDDIPCIFTLDLQMQEPFRVAGFKIVPKKFINAKPSYVLDERSIPEYFEEKAKRYLRQEREKQNAWRVKQNESGELKPYTSEVLESGELDKLNGARRTPHALDWMKTQIFELRITVNRINNLLQLIQREYDVKRQILECYDSAHIENKSKSYLNLRSYMVAWYNYNFSVEYCRALSTIYEFKFRPALIDNQSRAAHNKREAFVSAIPKSYTPETLPKMPQMKRVTTQKEPMDQDSPALKESFKQFVKGKQEEDADFSITMSEYIAFQDFSQHFPPSEKQESSNKEIIDFNYEKAAKQYKIYSDYLEFTKYDAGLEIEPKEFIRYARFLQIMEIALSYQDYLTKVALREDLKLYFKKKGRTPANPLEFTSSKSKLLDLIEKYQGKKQNCKNSLLGKYFALHQEIAELDKQLIRYSLMDFSLYELEKYERYLRPLSSTIETIVKKPFYVIGEDFKKWEEIGLIEGGPLKKPYEKTRTKKKAKVIFEVSSSEETRQLPVDIVEKTIKFISQCHKDFNSEVFLLGLSADQAEYLQKCLQEEKQNTFSYTIKGLRPVKIGGSDWVLSLAPITPIDLSKINSAHLSPLPNLVAYKDKAVEKRVEARFQTYQDELKKHTRQISEIEADIEEKKEKIKTFRGAQSLGIGSLFINQSFFQAPEIPQFGEELESLKKSLERERDSDSALESEQLSMVDTLSRLFGSDEVLSSAQNVLEDEETSSLKKLIKKAEKLRQALFIRGKTKGTDQEKSKLNLAIRLLGNVFQIIEHIKQIEEKQKKKVESQTKLSYSNWALYFYAHLQAMPWQKHQRIKVSFSLEQDSKQFDIMKTHVLSLMQASYGALFMDIFEHQSQKDPNITAVKLNDKELGIIIDLEDLQPPVVTSLMQDKA